MIVETDKPGALRTLLAAACGEHGVVRKRRHLYLVGRARVHLDAVEGLGDFLELEVVLMEHEPPTEGRREAIELMARLGVSAHDLVEGAYVDLIGSQSARNLPKSA